MSLAIQDRPEVARADRKWPWTDRKWPGHTGNGQDIPDMAKTDQNFQNVCQSAIIGILGENFENVCQSAIIGIMGEIFKMSVRVP